MHVVSHSSGGLGGVGMEVVVGKHVGKARMGWWHDGGCQITSPVRGEDANDTLSHCLPGAQLWVGSNRNLSVFQGRH